MNLFRLDKNSEKYINVILNKCFVCELTLYKNLSIYLLITIIPTGDQKNSFQSFVKQPEEHEKNICPYSI